MIFDLLKEVAQAQAKRLISWLESSVNIGRKNLSAEN
jgi:hypothetical protein